MKAQNPEDETGTWWYFIDKCLLFGASISCAIFQRFSNSLKFLVEAKAGVVDSVTNYLDDFLFLALTVLACNNLVNTFLFICSDVRVPIVMEKTEWACECIVFLGILLNGKLMKLMIPMEKREKAIKLLCNFLDRKKATIKEMQELCGYLNFLCKAIFPGRPFLRRMYSKYGNLVQILSHHKEQTRYLYPNGKRIRPYHHIKLDQEFKTDCSVWLQFLDRTSSLNEIVNHPMIDVLGPSSYQEIFFFSDTNAARELGYGCVFNNRWMRGDWGPNFMDEQKPTIEYLELFTLTAGILTWSNLLRNCRITIFCDNQVVVGMVNKLATGCKNCMVLIRKLALDGLKATRHIHVKFIPTKLNFLSDSLLRNQMGRFHKLGPQMNEYPDVICEELWPIDKIWVKH